MIYSINDVFFKIKNAELKEIAESQIFFLFEDDFYMDLRQAKNLSNVELPKPDELTRCMFYDEHFSVYVRESDGDGYYGLLILPKSKYFSITKNGNCVVIFFQNIGSFTAVKDDDKEAEKCLDHYCSQLSRFFPSEEFFLKQTEFKQSILKIAAELQSDQYFQSICNNFLDFIPSHYFCDPSSLLSTENYLRKRDDKKIGTLLLFPQRRKVIPEDKYFKEYYEKFSEILTKHYQIEDVPLKIFLPYYLLQLAANKHYAQQWTQEFPEFSTRSDDSSFDDLVKLYCENENVDRNNSIQIGRFVYYLLATQLINNELHFIQNHAYVAETISRISSTIEVHNFETLLLSDSPIGKITIDDIDTMGGLEFESFVASLFAKYGYSTEVTKASGDQGVDVIAKKNQNKIAIQAKCYGGKVTNSAIQEVVAGMRIYNCQKGLVATNNYFTDSAIELAKSNDVILWDRDMLIRKIDEINWK